MNWRESLIAQHEKQIATLRQAIDWMEDGTMATGDIEAGRKTDTTQESIAMYEGMVENLQSLVDKLKSGAI